MRVGAGAMALLLLTGAGCSGPHRVDTGRATAWDSQAAAAFAPLTAALPAFDRAHAQWVGGTTSGPDLQAAAGAATTAFTDARRRVDALPPFPGDARVNSLYRASVLLDLQSAHADDTAGTLPPGPLSEQVGLLSSRLRHLADRVFDRGRALVQPALGPVDPNLIVNLPEEVPNWQVEGLAAGPPLDPQAPAARPLPASAGELRAPSRPSGSRAAWERAVRSAAIPRASTIDAAVTGVAEVDGGIARTLVAAAEALRATPDPGGDREESARVRLGLLVDADAVYAARAAALAGAGVGDHLGAVARRLDLIGAGLWSPALGPRVSSLSPALLTDDG
ncbi:MAG: hypothetical protein NVSMB12_12350 [Acidimicrobiales bacterium]